MMGFGPAQYIRKNHVPAPHTPSITYPTLFHTFYSARSRLTPSKRQTSTQTLIEWTVCFDT